MQFWVNVTVPRRTPPGIYKGAISFSYQNKTIDVVPIEVKVLKLRLVGSSKQYVLYTSYGPGSPGSDSRSYCQFLNAFKKLGFKQVTVSADPARFGEAVLAYSAAGMMSPVPVLTYAFTTTAPTVGGRQVAGRRRFRRRGSIPAVRADGPSGHGRPVERRTGADRRVQAGPNASGCQDHR